jgi:hypothetical protein
MKYSIKITYPNGQAAYLSHKNKTEWCKKTAQKYLERWNASHGTGHKVVAEIEKAN